MGERFKGKVALVTGGSRGIGKSIASFFAEEGAKVAILDVNEKALSNVGAELEQYDVYIKVANVVQSQEVEMAVKEVVDTFGSIDIVVNNAGVIRDNLLFKMSDNDWQTVMDVHLKGSFNVAKAVQEYMVRKNSDGSSIFLLPRHSGIGDRQTTPPLKPGYKG